MQLAPNGLTTHHEVKATAKSSIAEGAVLRAVGFVLTHSTVPDLHSHSWASALWRNYATGDYRRTYISFRLYFVYDDDSHLLRNLRFFSLMRFERDPE